MMKHVRAFRHRLQERRRYAQLLAELERINLTDDPIMDQQDILRLLGDRRR